MPSSAHADWRNLVARLWSAAILAPLALVFALSGGVTFAAGVAVATLIGLYEWLRMVSGGVPAIALVTLAALTVLYEALGAEAALLALVAATVGLAAVFGATGIRNRLLTAAGLPYLGLTAIGLPWLRDSGPDGLSLVLFALLVVWASDIGAYGVGRAVGGPLLAPSISPRKTWAGFAGGLGCACMTGLIWAYFSHAAAPLAAFAVAGMLSVIGQLGDLFESSIKRRFAVKDSGGLIPGHGGVLDRIDALLWVVPIFSLMHAVGWTAGLLP